MTHHEMEMLLACVKHYMPMELRGKVMRELPAAYNAWMGHDVVAVVRTSDVGALPLSDDECGPMHRESRA